MQQEEKKGQGGSQKHNEGASVYKKRIPSTHMCLPEGASASYAEGTNHEEGHAEGISNNLRERTSQESVDKKQTELDKEARKPESPNHEDDHAEGISINLKERPSQGSVDKKQIESDKETRQLEIGNNLVSEAVTKNTLFLEKLSRYLDLERRYISCWRHLAYALKVPTEETQKFDIYTEHSPTEDLLNFLEGNHPDLYVKELKEKLHNVYRNDVIEALQKDGYTVGSRVRDLVLKKPKFTALLSSMLDKESSGNWKSLANEFGIEKQKSDQFGLLGCGPTGALFLHIQTDEKLRYLTMGQLRGHFCEMELKKLVSLLEEGDSRLVRDVAPIGSNLLAEICKHLNVEARYVKNWSNLANKLGIPPEVYAAFDTSKAKAKSPTKEMFKCLAQLYPNLVVSDLLAALKKIERFDVVDLVREETNVFAAKEALFKLQEMHQYPHKQQKQEGNLRMIASNKGFEVVDNKGEGNCMFHALCHQLEYKNVKHLEFSHQELRDELVKYLHEHPKLSDGTELAGFIVKDHFPSWAEYLQKMAKDGTWGENVILFAAANCYNCDIRVISSVPGYDWTVRPDPPTSDAVQLVLGHFVEEHYVSLVPSMPEDREGQLQQSPSNFPKLDIQGQHQPETNGKEDCTFGSESLSL